MIELTHKYKFLNPDDICPCRSAKKSTGKKRMSERPLAYPPPRECTVKTFQINYNKKLSSIAKSILYSFKNKYIYYAIEDILDLFRSNPTERENLLTILYSPVLSLQNNLSISFFDIWIQDIHIQELSKGNRFFPNDFKNVKEGNSITIKLFYTTRLPSKKRESLW